MSTTELAEIEEEGPAELAPLEVPKVATASVTSHKVEVAAKTVGYHAWRIPRYLLREAAMWVSGLVRGTWAATKWILSQERWGIYQDAKKDGKAGTENTLYKEWLRQVMWKCIAVGGLAIFGPHLIGQMWWKSELGVSLGIEKQQAITHGYLLVYGIPLIAALLYGRKLAGSPPVVDKPESRDIGDLSLDAINEALYKSGVIRQEKDPDTRETKIPKARHADYPDSDYRGGSLVTLELPSGRTFADHFLPNIKAFGSSLGVPLTRIYAREGHHPGIVSLWIARKDPYAVPLPAHPLLARTEPVSIYQGGVLGLDVQGQLLAVPFDNVAGTILGGRTGSGKSTGARSLMLSPVLDPMVDIYCFDAKGGTDWAALEPRCVQFEDGDPEEQARKFGDLLDKLNRKHIETMDFLKTVPASINTDRRLNRAICERYSKRFTVIVVDEFQELLQDPEHGKENTKKLDKLLAKCRASGIHFVLITQNPDSRLDETWVRARNNLANKIAYKCASYHHSNIILGDNMSKQGYNAAELTKIGACIVVADLNGNGISDDPAQYGRTIPVDIPQWEAAIADGTAMWKEALKHQQAPATPLPSAPQTPEIEAAPEPEPSIDRDLLVRVLEVLEENGAPMQPAQIRDALGEDAPPLNTLGKMLKAAGVEQDRTAVARRYKAEAVRKALAELT